MKKLLTFLSLGLILVVSLGFSATEGHDIDHTTSTLTSTVGDINLTATNDGVNITTGSGTADDFIINTNQFVVEGDTGNVGIGTADPVEVLDIQDSTGHATMSLWASGGGTDEAQIDFVSGSDTTRLLFRDSDNSFEIFHIDATVFTINTNGAILINQLGSSVVTVSVNGATTFAVTRNVIQLTCTGTENIITITGGVSGQLLTILHEDTDCTLDDTDDDTADQLDLVGSNGDLVGAADLVIQLVYNGTHWLQVSSSAN